MNVPPEIVWMLWAHEHLDSPAVTRRDQRRASGRTRRHLAGALHALAYRLEPAAGWTPIEPALGSRR